MSRATLTAVAAALALVLTPTAPAASPPTFKGVVGPGFTISMSKPKKAGKIRLVVTDKATSHNFRLKGPGVNIATSVPATTAKTFTVTLKKGKYTFLCDPHATSMVGSFTVK